MKRSKNVFNRATAGVLAGSILASSCTDPRIFSEKVIVSDIGVSAIKINFSKEEIVYFKFLDKLAADIVKSPEIAKEFSQNPQQFLRSSGFDRELSLDEQMLNIVLALADEDIQKAIENKDIKGFIRLLNEKNLISIDASSNLSAEFYNNLSDQEKKALLLSLGVNEADIDKVLPVFGVFTVVFLVVGAIISYAAILYTAAVSVSVYFAMAVAQAAAVVTTTKTYTTTTTRGVEIGTGNTNDHYLGGPYDFESLDPVFKIWLLKGDPESTYFLVDEYINQYITDVMEVAKELRPELNTKIDMSKVEQTAKLNVIKQQAIIGETLMLE